MNITANTPFTSILPRFLPWRMAWNSVCKGEAIKNLNQVSLKPMDRLLFTAMEWIRLCLGTVRSCTLRDSERMVVNARQNYEVQEHPVIYMAFYKKFKALNWT